MQPSNQPSFNRPDASPAEDIDAEFDAATGQSRGGAAIGKYIVLGLLVVVGFVAWRSFGPKPVLAGWSQDWSSAAQPTGKPTLVLFTADWCPPCKQFKQELARDDVSSCLRKNYSLVVVDLTDRTSENNSRAAWYGVQAIPTLILFNAEGVEAGRNNGMSGDDLLTWLHRGGKF